MPVLTAAVVLVGALGGLNLLLTVAILRRLRQRPALLGGEPGPEELVGRTAPEFAVTTTEGAKVTSGDLSGREYLIGFFSTTCAPCLAQAPEFAQLVLSHRDPSGGALAILVGDGPRVGELTTALSGVPTVLAARDEPVVEQFDVGGFPAMLVVGNEGTIIAASASARSLTASQPG